MDVSEGHLVQSFGSQPPALNQKLVGDDIKSHEIDFVAIGVQGAWVIGSQRTGVWGEWNNYDQLGTTLGREIAAGHQVKVCRALYPDMVAILIS